MICSWYWVDSQRKWDQYIKEIATPYVYIQDINPLYLTSNRWTGKGKHAILSSETTNGMEDVWHECQAQKDRLTCCDLYMKRLPKGSCEEDLGNSQWRWFDEGDSSTGIMHPLHLWLIVLIRRWDLVGGCKSRRKGFEGFIWSPMLSLCSLLPDHHELKLTITHSCLLLAQSMELANLSLSQIHNLLPVKLLLSGSCHMDEKLDCNGYS